ncbi:hypothetical protein H2203_004979 [Taxawa tesnikishii (nom. ined.)]|nr:hypothetical protein H2203_004979 [Dothideales sp. JES 119]
MKPRPALPSFGSVRSKKLPVRAEPAEEVTETVSSSMSASVSTLPDSVETSNDDVIGAVIANHHAAKGRITEPQRESTEYAQAVPLQSASVEGSGDTSDTSDYAEVEPEGVRQRIRPATAAAYGESSMPDGDVPAINLLPPTPGTDEEGKRLSMGTATARPQLQKRRSMPGEWDEPAPEEQHSDVESLPEEPQSLQPSAPVTSFERRSPQLAPIDESDSDDSAAFSDAAEDLSDLDDGGFASLDAIVESPVAPHAPDVAISTPPDSPSVRLPAPSTAPVKSSPLAQESGDWREATAYWSSLSKKKREQIEQEALPTEAEPPSPVAPVKKTKKKQPEAVNTLPAAAATPKALETAQQARAPAMRKSMRAASGPTPATNEPNMRTSMRDTRSGGMKTSMRGTNNAPAPPQEQKRTIKSASSDNLRGAALSSASAAAAANRQPVKRTTAPRPASALATVPVPVANDSDSESSFRKRRRPSVSTVDSAGRYTMKRSMRAGSIDSETRPISPTPTGRGAGRMSLRSLSPTGSFLGRNRESLMNSLRGGPVDNTPTMRGKNSKARQSKTSSGFSMSGFSKDSKPAKAAPPKMGSRFKSRFDDSDDEGDAAPSRFAFRSRFADSDDEDDSPVGPPRHIPADLTPVRGIPRRRGQDDEDSTDLDDSDEEAARPTKTGARDSQRTKSKPGVPSQSDVDKAMEAARRNVAAMNGGREPGVPEAKAENKATNQVTLQPQAEVLQPGSSPSKAQELGLDTPKRRRGVLGSILGRKRTSSSVVPTMASYASPGTEPAGPQSPVTLRSPRLQRKNTPQFSRQNTGLSTTIPPPPQTAAQMQESAPQVNTPGGISQNSQNWPLPPPPNVTADGVGAARPATSDGVSAEAIKLARTMRPDIGRRSQSGGNILDGADGDSPRAKGGKNVVYSERTGRKKKFAGLRRLFGLTD